MSTSERMRNYRGPVLLSHGFRAFFLIWLAAAVWPFLRPPAKAWSEQLGLAALLLLALPLLNAATGPSSLLQAMGQGNWVLASVDLMAILCGLACAHAAWRARPGRVKAPKPRARVQASQVPGE